jgi:hypothetical protein
MFVCAMYEKIMTDYVHIDRIDNNENGDNHRSASTTSVALT